MLKHALLFLAILSAPLADAQPFAIGTRSITFTDASRSRDIPCTVHYPALTGGNATPAADGTFPVLVHGHGFVMTVDAYTNLRDGFVPKGYILVLPTTEGGFAPAHASFGQDLSFLADALQAAGADPSSPLFGHVAPATALMGHSMGGGASFLGAANNANIQALVNFAPAETNPSAIAAAANVQVPTLVFAATEDCVTPTAANQRPMYDAVPVACKAFVEIIGGGHCFFGASSFTCSFGEVTCGPDLTISREQQHDVMNDFAGLWLDHFLKDDVGALSAFRDSVLMSDRVIAETACITTAIAETPATNVQLSPVPVSSVLRVDGLASSAEVYVFDIRGRCCLSTRLVHGSMDISELPSGSYYLRSGPVIARFIGSFVVAR